MSKQPAILFYYGDWKRDACVNACSPAARGIWFDFLCDMYDSQSGGVLTGDEDYLCRVGRCSRAELTEALSELTKTHTADISRRGDQITVVNRRLQRAAEISAKRAIAGSKGGSKTATNLADVIANEIQSGEDWLRSKEFVGLIADWKAHRVELRKPLTLRAELYQIRELKQWGKDRAFAAVRHSIAKGWEGIYEPRQSRTGQGDNGTKPLAQWEIKDQLESIPGQIRAAEKSGDWKLAKKLADRERELKLKQTGLPL